MVFSHTMNSLFHIDSQDGSARAGTLRLAHATVQTPLFMPVGTQASVKTLISEDFGRVGVRNDFGEHLSSLVAAGD
jgi:queuine/archaeosine tRNA-ribosyltransferase